MRVNFYHAGAGILTIAAVTVNIFGGVPASPLIPVGIALLSSLGVLVLALVGGPTRRVYLAATSAVALIVTSVPVGGIILTQREQWTRSAVEQIFAHTAPAGCQTPSSLVVLPVTCSHVASGTEYAYYSPAMGWCTLRSSAPARWDCIVAD
jgi:hypothetical protein